MRSLGSLRFEPSVGFGLMLVATAAGAPFLIKLTQRAEGDLAYAAGLLVLLLVITIIYMPVVVPLIAPEAAVSAMSIATPLVLTTLLPLGVGLLVDAWFEPLTERLLPIMNKASSVALLVVVVGDVSGQLRSDLGRVWHEAIRRAHRGRRPFAIGYFLGGPDIRKREGVGLGTAQRNIAAATVVATQTFGEADTVVMVIVTSVASMCILFPVASALRRRAAKHAEVLAADQDGSRRTPWV